MPRFFCCCNTNEREPERQPLKEEGTAATFGGGAVTLSPEPAPQQTQSVRGVADEIKDESQTVERIRPASS